MTARQITTAELKDLQAAYDPSKNMSPPFMTKFERTAVKGMRMEQLVQGAPSVLSEERVKALNTFEDIVDEEMNTGVVPVMLVRRLPTGEREIWKFRDLKTV